MQYLDKNGMKYLWSKIKAKFGSYENLDNKPSINNIELSGNKSLKDIGVQQTYIGNEEPTDESITVWIEPNGEAAGIPTKTSQLINDSGFVDETFVDNAIANAITSTLEEEF